VRRDTAALIGIVNELLAAAGGEAADVAAVTDAAADAASVVSSLRLLGAERHVDIELRSPVKLWAAMPSVSFRRCVTALVDNAMAHTADGGVVEVELAERGARVELVVTDHGPGIRGIAPERVFERFAHSDPGAGEGLPRRTGFGLGLALVRDVAARNGGAVRVGRTGPGGTSFVLELPRAAAPSA